MFCLEVALFIRKPIICRPGVNTSEDKKKSVKLGLQGTKTIVQIWYVHKFYRKWRNIVAVPSVNVIALGASLDGLKDEYYSNLFSWLDLL